MRTSRAAYQRAIVRAQLVRALDAMLRATEALATCLRMALELERVAGDETCPPTEREPGRP